MSWGRASYVYGSASIVNVYFSEQLFTENLVQLLQQFGKGYLSLHRYNCHKALEHFSMLPPQHFHTGWVLAQVGRAHFELAEYRQVSRHFTAALWEIKKIWSIYMEICLYSVKCGQSFRCNRLFCLLVH